MAKTNASMMAGGSSWLEQFTGAFEVQAGKWLDRLTREFPSFVKLRQRERAVKEKG